MFDVKVVECPHSMNYNIFIKILDWTDRVFKDKIPYDDVWVLRSKLSFWTAEGKHFNFLKTIVPKVYNYFECNDINHNILVELILKATKCNISNKIKTPIDNTPEDIKEALEIVKLSREYQKDTINKTIKIIQMKNNYLKKYGTLSEKIINYLTNK